MDPTKILGEGPYVWNVIHDHVESTRPSGQHTRPVKLPLTVTVPMTSNPGSAAPPGPFPVCILLNGFQVGLSVVVGLGGGAVLGTACLSARVGLGQLCAEGARSKVWD